MKQWTFEFLKGSRFVNDLRSLCFPKTFVSSQRAWRGSHPKPVAPSVLVWLEMDCDELVIETRFYKMLSLTFVCSPIFFYRIEAPAQADWLLLDVERRWFWKGRGVTILKRKRRPHSQKQLRKQKRQTLIFYSLFVCSWHVCIRVCLRFYRLQMCHQTYQALIF